MQQILRWGMLITCCSRHRVHSTPILLSTQSVHNHIPVQPIVVQFGKAASLCLLLVSAAMIGGVEKHRLGRLGAASRRW